MVISHVDYSFFFLFLFYWFSSYCSRNYTKLVYCLRLIFAILILYYFVCFYICCCLDVRDFLFLFLFFLADVIDCSNIIFPTDSSLGAFIIHPVRGLCFVLSFHILTYSYFSLSMQFYYFDCDLFEFYFACPKS